jgi:hypothetical protein
MHRDGVVLRSLGCAGHHKKTAVKYAQAKHLTARAQRSWAQTCPYLPFLRAALGYRRAQYRHPLPSHSWEGDILARKPLYAIT